MEEMNQIIKNLQEELHDERDKNQGMAIECHQKDDRIAKLERDLANRDRQILEYNQRFEELVNEKEEL